MTTMRVVGECFFWYRLTRVFPDKFHRAVKRLCVVCVCVFTALRLVYVVVVVLNNASFKLVGKKIPETFRDYVTH